MTAPKSKHTGVSAASPLTSSYATIINCTTQKQTNKLRGLSPHANYTDRAAAAGRRS